MPLANNAEQQLVAIAMLEETICPEHPAAEETLERFGKIEARKFPAIFIGIAAAIVLVTSVSTQFTEVRLLTGWFHSPFFYDPAAPPLPAHLTPQQRLLIGDPAIPDLRQKELLYESDTENPAYYAEYMSAYYSEHEELPPHYFETVARIAPENSFFLYYAAGRIGGESVDKKRSKGSASPRFIDGVRLSPLPTEKEHGIIDQAAFDEAMSLIAKAAQLPDFETYGNTMMSARAVLFPNETLTESLVSFSYQYRSSASHLIALRNTVDLLCAQAQHLSNAADEEKFLTLVDQQLHLVKSFSNNPDIGLINELVFSVVVAATAQYFHWSADRLGLQELSDEYETQWRAIQDDKDQREIRGEKDEPGEIAVERGSFMSRLSLPLVMRQVAVPIPLTAADLKPLRLVDHEVSSRLGIIAAALIIAILCLPVYFFRYHSPRPIRIPAIHLSRLLRPVDWVWIVALGIILPIVVFLAINRLTPLGGREYGIQHFLFFFPGTQIVAIILNLLLAPAILIRWRLSKRLGPFGIKSRPTLIPIAVLFLVLVWSLGVYPIVHGVELSQGLLIVLAAVPALWLANIFLNIILAFIGKPAGRIPRVATTSALLPAYAVAIIALCLTLPLFISSEKHWMKQDALFRINPDAADLGAYEYKVALQKRKEINVILGLSQKR